MPDLKKMLTLEALSEALPSWLKRSTKPEYNADEIDSTLTTNQFVTASDKDNWNAKGTYSKPSGGIPKSDLSNLVQASLDLADSALQSETDPTVPSWAKQTNKPSYTQDEVADGSTYKRVTQNEKDAWSGKQNALTTTQMQAVNSGITSAGVAQISTNQTNIASVQSVTEELVDKGAKNLYDISSFAGYSDYGMTLTNNGDGTITANGTVSIAFIGVNLTPLTLDAGTYVLSGCPSGGGNNSYMLQINSPSYVEDIGDGAVFTLTSSATITVRIRITQTSTSITKMFKPMICTKAEWDISQQFEPHGLQNYELTKLQSEDRAALAEAIDNGVKNLLPKLKSYTGSGLSMVINDDNSITAKWSATGSSTLYARINDNNWTLPRGTYVLSGMPNDNNIGCYIHIETNTSQLVVEQERKTPVKFTIASDYEYLKIYISVRPNSAAETSGVTILPMIVTKAVSDIGANSYVPPALQITDLSVRESEDRAALAEVVDSWAKNVLDGNWESTDIFTVNSDKSVTVNGTTGESAATLELLGNGSGGYVSNNYGGYVLSGCSDGSMSSYSLCVFYSPNGSTWGAEQHQTTADTPIIIRNDYAYIRIVVLVRKNQTITNKTVYPILCKKPLYDVSPKFVPYRPSYDVVVADVAKAQYTVQTANFACSAANTYEYTGLSVTVPAGHIYEISAYDSFSNNAPIGIAIALTNNNAEITTTTTMVAEASGKTSADTFFACRSVTCITNITSSNRTYYLFVKHNNNTGSNPIALMWRQIV